MVFIHSLSCQTISGVVSNFWHQFILIRLAGNHFFPKWYLCISSVIPVRHWTDRDQGWHWNKTKQNTCLCPEKSSPSLFIDNFVYTRYSMSINLFCAYSSRQCRYHIHFTEMENTGLNLHSNGSKQATSRLQSWYSFCTCMTLPLKPEGAWTAY